MDHFILHSEYAPTGDQPQAIEELVEGFKEGNQFQTLLGVTGSGKTFTMANVIAKLNLPTLVISHNKTLAAQLYGEFKEFFPENAVEYFVSYYDYYQPEAYVPSSDTYIEKDSAINDEIDKLRHSATAALSERKDVVVVSSVSCIYGLGDPIDYEDMTLSVRPGQIKDMEEVVRRLIDIQYTRNDMDFKRGTFRIRGDVVEIFPVASTDKAVRLEFFGDEIDRISEIDVLTGNTVAELAHVVIFAASHYVVAPEKMKEALSRLEEELDLRIKYFKSEDKLIEAQRIKERTNFDIEMMRETGFCSGIENYSGPLSGRPSGSMPFTLIDYFPDEFLIIVDESHITIPQIGGMYAGDRSRKTTLVDYGFRLPSALDNRPLNFTEFENKIDRMLFVSATPSEYEAKHELLRTEQIIRPTGLVDPEIIVKPTAGQIDDLISEVKKETEKKNKVLVTTLTKKMAEDLTDYMREAGIRVRYLRSETSLIQTIGRAARNADGHVIMYADTITGSMNRAITETERRRAIQMKYNEEHGIVPQTIKKKVRDLISISKKVEEDSSKIIKDAESMSEAELKAVIKELTKKMNQAAVELNFETAAKLRDEIIELKKYLVDLTAM